ncbi:MAG: hypothetical protein R6X20_15985 [Phycisphaerae bacterium]
MLTFRMDETNFEAGSRDGVRIVEGPGLAVDFDEFAPDADTLGLWHLHDGACAGEGTGLDDASGSGHDLDNQGAESVQAGYRFVGADRDYMETGLAGQPERPAVTLEAWVRDWLTPVGDTGQVAILWRDADHRLDLSALRAPDPADSYIRARLRVAGAWVGHAMWHGVEADALLAGTDPWHVAAGLESPGRLTLYVNGTARAEDDSDIQPLPAGDYTLTLGTYLNHSTWPLSAVLDEVRLSAAARYAAAFEPHRLLAAGTYTGLTFDAVRLAADWTDLAPSCTVPPGCILAWQVRAADETDVAGDPQALWQSYDGDPATLPDGRYFQWRATLSADDERLASPTVASVEALASEAGYNLFLAGGDGPGAIDYADPCRRVGPGVQEVATDPLAAGAVHWFGIRPVDTDGRESPITQSEVRLELDADGAAVPDRPASPLALHAEPLPAGEVLLRWRYRVGYAGLAPDVFRVFGDGGTGTIDYETPLGEMPYDAGRVWHVWTGDPLAPGVVHQLAVRAVAAGEVWDEPPAVVQATPDAAPPGAVDALSAEVLS